MPRKFAMIAFTAMCAGICGCKATAPADTAPVDSATFDPDGTAHITVNIRVRAIGRIVN